MKQLSKNEILSAIESEHQLLFKTLNAVPEERWIERTVHPTPHPGQSCKDLLGHLIAWHELMLSYIKNHLADGSVPKFPKVAQFNQEAYQSKLDIPLDRMTQDFEDSYQEVLEFVRGLPEEDFAKKLVWQMFGYNTYNHYKWARKIVRVWLKGEVAVT